MKRHISESEIEIYLLEGTGSLKHDRLLHIEGCKSCRLMIEQSVEIHAMLKKLRPIPVDQGQFQGVEARILATPRKSVKKRDWLTYISLLLLAVIAISIAFSGQSPMFLTNQESDLYHLNDTISKNIDGIINLKDRLPHIVIPKSINDFSVGSPLFIILFSIVVLVFYMFLDRYYSQKFFRQ
ncbi:MAG: hypothetical protein AB7T22_00795 [Calditrichaceae bacterium]